MWLAATHTANMWTATITEEAWKKMGSWSLSETPPHRSPHTREAQAEPHVLYDAAAGIGTPFWNSTPFDPVTWLHHAADDTIPLLKEARRVVKPDGRVVVVEDLRADDAAGLRHQDSEHKGCPRRCVFRTDNEWRAIFRRLGLRVESTAAPPRDCIPHYKVDRALYVIT